MNKPQPHIYILLWCLYSLQGTLFSTGGTLSHLLLIAVIVLSLYYFVLVICKFRLPKVLQITSVLVAILSIYGLINIMFGNGAMTKVPSYFYLRNVYCSLLPLYAFYYFTKKGLLTDNMLRMWSFVFLALAITQYFRNQTIGLEALAESGSTAEEVTNNAGYILLSILPLIPLFNNKPLIQYSFLGICLVFVLMAMKRGAIVAGAIASLFFLVSSFHMGYFKKKKLSKLILTGILIAIAVYAVQYMLLTSDYFNYRIEKTLAGDSSGRNQMYVQHLDYFLNQTNIFSFLFGGGADETLRVFGEFAHNDWLEIAINNGLFVLVIYFLFWISLFKSILTARKSNYTCYLIISLFAIIYFAKSIFSMTYNNISLYSCSAIGYALAEMSSRNKELQQ